MMSINHLIGKVIAPARRRGVGVYGYLFQHGLKSIGQVLMVRTPSGAEW
jgi:hypothetical protein